MIRFIFYVSEPRPQHEQSIAPEKKSEIIHEFTPAAFDVMAPDQRHRFE
jgi:hypothetical protein